MASRKMKLKKEHTTFNVPIQVISQEEAAQKIIDSLLESKEAAAKSQTAPTTRTTEESRPASITKDSVPDISLQNIAENKKSVRTFKGVAYSGKPIDKHFVFENLFLDVDGMTFKQQVPIFKNHDPSQVVGFGMLRRESGQLLIEGTLATELDSAKEIAALSDAGFNWELSVGVEPDFIEEVNEDRAFEINGKQAKGPAVIFRRPKVMETSFVPIGADRNTSAQVFSNELNKYKNIEVRNMDITTINVDGKEVEVTKNEEGNFSLTLELETLDLETDHTFCACMEGKELEDEETEKKKKSLSDENAALLEEVAELRAKNKEYEKEKKRAKFEKAVSTSAIEFGDDTFDTIVALPEEQFNAFLTNIENTKSASTAISDEKASLPSKELFKQDKPATSDDNTVGFTAEQKLEIFNKKADALVKEYADKGAELSRKDAKLMLGRQQKHY